MALRKKGTDWDRLQQRSANVRRGVHDLAEELQRICGQDEHDAIRGAKMLSQELEKWRQAIGSLAPSVGEILDLLEKERKDQASGLDHKIQRAVSNRGFQVLGEGSLLVVDGFIHVEVDAEGGVIKVDGRACEGSAPALVADAVSFEVERLRKLMTPPGKMLKQVQTAYVRELVGRGKKPGTQIETDSLLMQLILLRQDAGFRSNPSTANFREYPRELFRADLHELLASEATVIDRQRLRYASGSNTLGAVFMHVPALGRCLHVGRIWFEPATD